MTSSSDPAQPRVLYHGCSRGKIVGEIRFPLFLAYTPDLAYEGPLVSVAVHPKNPLVLDTPEKFRDAWQASNASNASGAFHPNATHAFCRWAASLGHDFIEVPESAFEGEVGFEWAQGTLGDPQAIALSEGCITVPASPTLAD